MCVSSLRSITVVFLIVIISIYGIMSRNPIIFVYYYNTMNFFFLLYKSQKEKVVDLGCVYCIRYILYKLGKIMSVRIKISFCSLRVNAILFYDQRVRLKISIRRHTCIDGIGISFFELHFWKCTKEKGERKRFCQKFIVLSIFFYDEIIYGFYRFIRGIDFPFCRFFFFVD